jgi:hypothetical protein
MSEQEIYQKMTNSLNRENSKHQLTNYKQYPIPNIQKSH